MGVIAVSGQPGCRPEETARLVAGSLGFDLITNSRLRSILDEEFGQNVKIPDKAFAAAALSVIARLAAESHLVVSVDGGEFLLRDFPGCLRVFVIAPEANRIGAVMLDRHTERASATTALKRLQTERKERCRSRFGRVTMPPDAADLIVNSASFQPEQAAALISTAAESRSIKDCGFLSPAAEARLQFQSGVKLARYGISPIGGGRRKRAGFMHPSEQIFANLLDFYRIEWKYEPRSFPVRWGKSGEVTEAFTPDFYLPEFDLYVELTTMKQSLVTKKNRKVKLLKSLYPETNIQVFYQKDFENLIFKHGLADRLITS